MKQQTAVEWLLKAKFELIFDKDMSKQDYLAKRIQIEEQAKQMEKEQIINTYLNACSRLTPYGYYNDSAEQYYNETYNK